MYTTSHTWEAKEECWAGRMDWQHRRKEVISEKDDKPWLEIGEISNECYLCYRFAMEILENCSSCWKMLMSNLTFASFKL